MIELDPLATIDDEQLLMDYVICGDAELLMLDTVLQECLTTNA